MSRMRRMKWRRVVERVDEVWEIGEAVRREVLEVKQKLWVGMRGEVGGDSGSLEVGCTEPLRAVSDTLTLAVGRELQIPCFDWILRRFRPFLSEVMKG